MKKLKELTNIDAYKIFFKNALELLQDKFFMEFKNKLFMKSRRSTYEEVREAIGIIKARKGRKYWEAMIEGVNTLIDKKKSLGFSRNIVYTSFNFIVLSLLFISPPPTPQTSHN